MKTESAVMEPLISLYIDNELSLDEKILFAEAVHRSRVLKEDTVALLKQEKQLRAEIVDCLPPQAAAFPRHYTLFDRLRSWRYILSGMGLAAAVLFLVFLFPISPRYSKAVPYRFVVYRPHAAKIAITGSFTNWKIVPLKQEGDSGYWDIILSVPPGEHRFSYIQEGKERFPDPTFPQRERDDFGGVNSILNTEV